MIPHMACHWVLVLPFPTTSMPPRSGLTLPDHERAIATCLTPLSLRSSALSNPIKLRSRADDQAPSHNRRRSHTHLVQRVLAQQLEFLARLNHKGVAVFT